MADQSSQAQLNERAQAGRDRKRAELQVFDSFEFMDGMLKGVMT